MHSACQSSIEFIHLKNVIYPGTMAILLLMPLPIARPAIWVCKQAETQVLAGLHEASVCDQGVLSCC